MDSCGDPHHTLSYILCSMEICSFFKKRKYNRLLSLCTFLHRGEHDAKKKASQESCESGCEEHGCDMNEHVEQKYESKDNCQPWIDSQFS